MEQIDLNEIISYTIGITGLISSIFFYLKSKKEKKPVYDIRTTQLLRKNITSIEKLDISYEGQELEDFSVTYISFWNAGRETIEGSDIVERDPIKINLEGYKIYDYQIIIEEEKNNIHFEKEGVNVIKLKFDYLDKNQGFLLKVYHNGSLSDFKLTGSIKGSRPIQKGYKMELVTKTIFENKLFKGFDQLGKKSPKFISFFLFILFIPVVMILFVFVGPIAVLEGWYDKYYNNPPKDFRLS